MNSRLFHVKRLLQNVRQLHSTGSRGAYEGSGKTTVQFLNQNAGTRIYIDRCTPFGFQFVDGSMLVGPLAIFPKTILCWNIASGECINEASLSLFITLEPKPDLVIIGLEADYDYAKIMKMKEILTKRKISVEILPVEKACAVYNFTSEEGRYVAAGLLPPKVKETHTYKKLSAGLSNIRKAKELESH